jgi:hypothetical protein
LKTTTPNKNKTKMMNGSKNVCFVFFRVLLHKKRRAMAAAAAPAPKPKGDPLVPAMPEAPVAMDVMWRQSAQNAILDYVLRKDPELAALMQRVKPILAAKGLSIVDGTASNSTSSSSFHTKLEALFPSDAADPNNALAIARLGGNAAVVKRLQHLFSYLHTWELFQRSNVALVEVLRKPSKGAAVLADDLETGLRLTQNKLKPFLPADEMKWSMADYKAPLVAASNDSDFFQANYKDEQTKAVTSDFLRKFLAVFYCRALATHRSAMDKARPDAPVEMAPDATAGSPKATDLSVLLPQALADARLDGNIPPIYLPLIALRSVVLFCRKVYAGKAVLVADESGKVVCPVGEQVAIYFGDKEVRDRALRTKLVELLRVHGQIKNVSVRCTEDFADFSKGQALDVQPLTSDMF